MHLPLVSRTQKLLVGCLGVGLVILGVSLLYISIKTGKPVADAPLKRAFEAATVTSSYTQLVETEAYFTGRRLYIEGKYTVDASRRAYAAISTTTLFVAGDPVGHVFTHENISIGDDVYTKVITKDALLEKAIQQLPSWQRFTSVSIPKQLLGIAVAGPIQDNLRILAESGIWVTLEKKPHEENVYGEQMLRYTFSLSGKKPESAGALDAIIQRIGSEGVIDAWIDPHTSQTRYLRFMNKEYVSTTTLLYPNPSATIEAPID